MYSTNDWRYYEGGELYHHGILGQKWGVRRYQNPDGSLTPAGRKRYSALSSAAMKASESGNNRKAGELLSKAAKVAGRSDYDEYQSYKAAQIYDEQKVVNTYKYNREHNKQQDQDDDELIEYFSQTASIYSKLAGALRQRIGDIPKEKLTDEQKKVDEWIRDNENYISMEKAKSKDVYSIDFLEAIQNKSMNKDETLKEYETYLNDPLDYWRNLEKHLSKYKNEGDD